MDRQQFFAANPMVMGFLSTALEDCQMSENESACAEERESVDCGTIYDCPDETFERAERECESFWVFVSDALRDVAERSLGLEAIGSDLYLERAGHGIGFRDRTYFDTGDFDDAGASLSALVSTGQLEIYIGDDGKAWFE